jgi:hypothetical protein
MRNKQPRAQNPRLFVSGVPGMARNLEVQVLWRPW